MTWLMLKTWYLLHWILQKNISDYESIHSAGPLYFIAGEVDGYIKNKNGNKYLSFPSTDKNKDVLTKYTELWNKIRNLIDRVDDKSGEYEKDFIKIKFNSDDNLSLIKTLKLHNLTVAFRSDFKENNRYYPQIALDECLYGL